MQNPLCVVQEQGKKTNLCEWKMDGLLAAESLMMPDFVGVSDDAGSIGTSTDRSQQRFITVDQCTLDLWQQKAHELYQRCGQHHKADCFTRSYIVNQFTNIPPEQRRISRTNQTNSLHNQCSSPPAKWSHRWSGLEDSGSHASRWWRLEKTAHRPSSVLSTANETHTKAHIGVQSGVRSIAYRRKLWLKSQTSPTVLWSRLCIVK